MIAFSLALVVSLYAINEGMRNAERRALDDAAQIEKELLK